jgi:hypothetical protein
MFTVKRLAIAGATITLAIGMAACSSAAQTGTTAPPASRGGVAAFPDEGIPTTTVPKIAVPKLHVGQTANLAVIQEPAGQTGAEAPRLAVDPSKTTVGQLQVSRVKTTHGGEFDTPERGLYLGVYVKAQNMSIPPEEVSWNMYVVVNGHHYDSTIAAEGFSPAFGNASLGEGEADEGWMVFDVPAAHGTVVVFDPISMHQTKIATWSF